MDQTIRVTGEKEIEVRAKLSEVEHKLRHKVWRRWQIDYPLYNAVFFVVFSEKDKLGEFDSQQGIILLSEDLIYQDFSVLRNVFFMKRPMPSILSSMATEEATPLHSESIVQ